MFGKKVSVFTVLLLTSSCFVSNTLTSAGGGSKSIIKRDKDILDTYTDGRAQIIKVKSQKYADKKRLSDKGDLVDHMGVVRRRFFTRPDGNCFFWGVGLPRQEAVDLLLQNSGVVAIRTLAAQEIYDEFIANKLPAIMKLDPDYIQLKARHSAQNIALHSRQQVELEIMNYCKRQNIYEDYVRHALSQSTDHMLHHQDAVLNVKTYFVDAIAHLKNANLKIWSYSVDRQRLVKTHEYFNRNAISTWELLHEGDHYTRLVCTHNNERGLAVALERENEDLEWLKAIRTQSNLDKVHVLMAALELDKCERLIQSNLLSDAQKAAELKKVNRLERKWGDSLKSNPLSSEKKAAFYQIMLNIASDEAAEVKRIIDSPPSGPTAFDLQLAQRLDDDGKPLQRCVKVVEDKKAQVVEFQGRLPSLQQRLQALKWDVRLYNECLIDILNQGVSLPGEIDTCDVLLQLSLYFGLLVDKYEAMSKDGKLVESSRAAASENHKKYVVEKKRFGDAFEKLQTTLFKDIDYQIRAKSKLAEQGLEKNLARNLVLTDTNTNLTESFKACERVVGAHCTELLNADLKYFNPVCLSKDPFLERVSSQLQAEEVTNAEWRTTVPQKIYKGVLHLLVPEEDREFVEANIGRFNHDGNRRAERATPISFQIDRNGFRLTSLDGTNTRNIYFITDADIAELSQEELNEAGCTHADLTRLLRGLIDNNNNIDVNMRVLRLLVPVEERSFVVENLRNIQYSPPSVNRAGEPRKLRTQSEIIAGCQLAGKIIYFVSEAEIKRRTKGELKRADLIRIFTTLEDVLNRVDTEYNPSMIEQKNLAKKRIKRIIKKFKENAMMGEGDPLLLKAIGYAKAGTEFCQNEGRCVDGVMSALDVIEANLFKSSQFAETEISEIFADYAHDFCQKFRDLVPLSDEWSTNAPQFVKQMTFFSLPHRGEPRTSFYWLPALISAQVDKIFKPTFLVEKFLKGGEVRLEYDVVNHWGGVNRRASQIQLEAFSADKAIDLVFNAYTKGLVKGAPGRILAYDTVVELISRDSFMDNLFRVYSDAISELDPSTDDASQVRSDLFETVNVNTNTGREFKTQFKREFFDYLLQRLGYVIDPRDPWGNQAFAFKRAEEAKREAALNALCQLGPGSLSKAPEIHLDEDHFDSNSFFLNKGGDSDLLKLEGFSVEENWGTWSVGSESSIFFPKDLPPMFSLTFTACAFGPNVGKTFDVTVGQETRSLVLQGGFTTHSLNFYRNTMGSNRVLIKIPQATKPAGGDRLLGIGLEKVRIGEISSNISIDFKKEIEPCTVTGLSGIEPSWGRWSDSKDGIVRFSFVTPLPRAFTVNLNALAYGPNVAGDMDVTVGSETKKVRFGATATQRTIMFDANNSGANTLTIKAPKPTIPKGGNRLLGIGLIHMDIQAKK